MMWDESDRLFDAIWILFERRPELMPGRVYFAQAETGGPVKIGYSLHPELRLLELQAGSPEPLKLRAGIAATTQLERDLHRLFAPERLRGEWFAPCDDLEKLIGYVADYDDTRMDLNELVEELVYEVEAA